MKTICADRPFAPCIVIQPHGVGRELLDGEVVAEPSVDGREDSGSLLVLLRTSCESRSSERLSLLTDPDIRVTVDNANMQTTRPYMKQARAVREGRTGAALLDAAERLFFERGWDATSLEAVAAEAGVTKQTLLRHFGSKAGLLEHAFARAFENVRDQRWDVPGDDVEHAVDNLLDHYEAVGDRALKIDAMAGVDAVAPWVQRAREMHHEWVAHAFGAFLRPLRGRDLERRRAGLIAVCDVHTWRLLRHQLGLGRAEARATLVMAIRGLLEVDR